MKKVSAVDWLAEQLLTKYRLKIDNYQEFEQAKEIDKENIIDAKNAWLEDDRDGEEYYNEVYGK